MSLMVAVAGTLAGAAVLVGGILVWARGRAKAQQSHSTQQESRQHYLALAAQAASDGSGRGLFKLLDALDTAPEGCPVVVSWLRHQPAENFAAVSCGSFQ